MEKEDNDVTSYELEPQLKKPPLAAHQHIDAVLQMVSQNHQETDDHFAHSQQQTAGIIVDTELHAGSSLTLHQVPISQLKSIPSNEPDRTTSDNFLSYIQRKDPDIQQIVSVISGDGLLPNQMNFTCRLFQKLKEQKKRLEVVTDSLYRKF